MKREIKFRAWSEVQKVMFYTDKHLTVWAGGAEISVNTNAGKLNGPFIGMQFTGLRDRNGKEIYEGDIVVSDRFPTHDQFESTVLDIRYLNSWMFGSSMNFNEVIGNIYENPELLKTNVK